MKKNQPKKQNKLKRTTGVLKQFSKKTRNFANQSRMNFGQPKKIMVAEPVSSSTIIRPLRNKPRTTVTHSERIANIDGVELFTLRTYVINPSNTTTFPWLGSIAASFENYILKSLKFKFNNACSTSTPGTVYMAFCLDFNTENPTTVDQISRYTVSTASAHVNNTLDVTLKEKNTERYCLAGDTFDETGDPRLYHLGKFWLATAGLGGTTAHSIGELWVEYTVELINPIRNDEELTNETIKYNPQTFFEIGARIVEGTLQFTEWLDLAWDFYGHLAEIWSGDLKKMCPTAKVNDSVSNAVIRLDQPGVYYLLDFMASSHMLSQEQFTAITWLAFEPEKCNINILVKGTSNYTSSGLNMHINAIISVTTAPCYIYSPGLPMEHPWTINYARTIIIPMNMRYPSSAPRNRIAARWEASITKKDKGKKNEMLVPEVITHE